MKLTCSSDMVSLGLESMSSDTWSISLLWFPPGYSICPCQLMTRIWWLKSCYRTWSRRAWLAVCVFFCSIVLALHWLHNLLKYLIFQSNIIIAKCVCLKMGSLVQETVNFIVHGMEKRRGAMEIRDISSEALIHGIIMTCLEMSSGDVL